MRLPRFACALLVAALVPFNAQAGTTGGITGRVTDSKTGAPLTGVLVTANSPSQSARSTSDATGTFAFLSLSPDTYTLNFSKTGYDPVTQPGLTVVADQVQTYNAGLTPTLRTIAHVTAQSAQSLVKPGTTSDVYSVNAAGQVAAQGLSGPGSLNNAYGAIASVPGVALDQGEQGWWQTVHVRGGDIDQVGYELDGIPVNRAYDNAPQTMLSSLGSQEVQVYTGGVPASSDAQGISGYINQVLKTGTYPGYGEANLAVGYPAFYHQASVEFGGSTPDRNFSYYVGIAGSNEDFRFVNNQNGAQYPDSFFYPTSAVPGYTCGLTTCTPTAYSNGYVYTGTPSPVLFTSGLGFALATQSLRDTVINLHMGIPHSNGLRDDVQLMWMTSENLNQYFSSIDDFGANTLFAISGPLTWDDSYLYHGQSMQPFVPSQLTQYFYPNSPPHPFGGPLPYDIRDPNENGVSITKLQYQHEFTPASYLRLYGYSTYSTWFINGYNSDAQPYYGWELPYFLPDHSHGYNLSYVNQLSSQHLLTVEAAYLYSSLERYDVTYFPPDWNITSFVGTNGKCYNPSTGDQIGCYDQTQGTLTNPSPPPTYSCKMSPDLPACAPGVNPQWLVTDTTFDGNLNTVDASLAGYSINDQWRPNDQLNVSLGLRIEDFTYFFGDTDPDDPARQFWFNAYNAEYCFAPGVNNNKPIDRTDNGIGPCPVVGGVATVPLADSPYGPLINTSGGSYVTARFQPRLGVTYTLDPNDVLRGSFGVYARPPNSSWTQYNTLQEDLPAFLGEHFYGYGFNTPDHLIRPDTSYNYDLSWEHHVKGTDWSWKLSPFLRATRDQLQNFYIDPQGGLESGLNVGSQQSSGVELALQKGDFSAQGLSGQLAFTYTYSQIKYQNFTNTDQNVIDQLDGYIKAYDSFLKGHGGYPCYFYESNGTGGAGTYNCNQKGVVENPYYNQPYQNLFSPTAWYPTYDVIPGPAAAANGYAVPYVTSLILNYRHNRLAVTNSWYFSSGAEYGSPTQWPGYNPTSCYQPPMSWVSAHGKAADPASCDDFGVLPLFIPDPFTKGYDNLGAFKQPWQLQMGVALTYDVSPRVTARLNFTNVLDICGQRGYPWDQSWICAYSSLPTNYLYPAGNFYPNSISQRPPPQLQYPYAFWFNGNNTGYLGVVEPLQVTGTLSIKL
ncbi:MAG TPA: TonB-dependent receptor [Candidatus Babeliales bacterium]|nr:TonB-dependent receptor [Candidatus Babeliales bacterium]